ncbi:helix-turn-helix domain-containing protein [Herbiconiux sp. A18JL235]|uniref:Helix-turn-helix domain-containing protein n=1 Tax=Herbiconiux sp. A18JL235 TaxID=3152363 RepID=A0AB39BLS9_9MICO
MVTERNRAIPTGCRHPRETATAAPHVGSVAERVGVTHGLLSQLERGRSNASLRTLYRIAQTLEEGPDSASPLIPALTRAIRQRGTPLNSNPRGDFTTARKIGSRSRTDCASKT